MGKGKKKKEQQKLLSLTNIANKHDGHITHHEFCGNFGIAIDKEKGFVFFNKDVNGEITEGFVDLNLIQECKVINTSVSVTKNKETYKMIERLDLFFKSDNHTSKDIKWEFFSRENNLQLYGEFQASERWSKLINEQIKMKVY
ncbi:hypothetical protein DJ013_03535 [Arcticibacterium luteifluviistationis]|uniref:Uncharacterized protein n=2 Tax=Arcticibacterium luteifluviistationis TaxID=1784714 RepID=A0A2Z4G7X4_9BACT|nr:hypothetical protein DJ013_03535 [Arcticibacterium luteifluviistationis]